MAARHNRSSGQGGQQQQQQQQQPPSSASARQNEYFVPRDGIDREVITSDICRYLGNDALVRPGTYESPEGRTIQGYFITAYRNLTSAMIQDLKADSARWEQERRAASRNGGGGSREQARGPSDYNSWKNRQDRTAQDYETSYPNPMAMDIDYPAPGPAKVSGGYPAASPYSGVPAPSYAPSSAYPPQPIAPVPGQYAVAGYGYPPNPPAQFSPQTGADRYPGMTVPPPGFGQDPMYIHGSNYQTTSGYVTSGPTRSLGVSAATTSRSLYAPTLPAPVYPDTTDPYGGGYAPAATSSHDPLLGRGAYNITTNPTPASSDDLGSPAGTTQPRMGYGGMPDSQYDETSGLQAPTTSTSSTPAQLATSGPSGSRRDRESEPREQRDRGDRGEHRDHRSRQDRDGRHRHGGHR